MSLNFLGLGFNFGAKDDGLEEKQKSIVSNFEAMQEQMSKMGKGAELGASDALKDVSAMEDAKEAVDSLAESLGDTLPEASKDGADSYDKASRDMRVSQDRVHGGFKLIRDAMEKLDTIARQNKLQTFIQAISLSRLNEIANGLGEIGTEGRNLTTGLEAEMVSLGKSARMSGANFGYTGKQLDKFSAKASSMAKSLNIDANTASLALRAYDEAGSELAAVGLKSAKDIAKFSEAFGVNADTLRNSTLRMRKEFGFSDDQINNVIGSFVEMGKITGDVTASLNELPRVADQLRRNAAAMNEELSPEELSKYASSTAALAAGFMQMGQSSDQAREAAFAISEQMIAGRENFNNMFGGTGDDISEFHKAFGIALGSIEKSFESMTKGPDQFIGGIADMVMQARKAGRDVDFTVLKAQLDSVFGPDQAATLVNFFKTADDATLGLMDSVRAAPADLGKMAKETFRTGRTLAETFELAQDRFVKNFRAISRKEARMFVKETTKEFGKFNKRITELASEGGPMGAFLHKMSEIHQVGTSALLPKTLRPMSAVFGSMVQEMTPAVTALGAMGFRFKMLFSPITLLLGAVVGLIGYFTKLRLEGKSADEALEEMASTLQRVIPKAIDYLGGIITGLMAYLPKVGEFVAGVWDGLISGVDPSKEGAGPAQKWGIALGAAIRTGLVAALDALKGYMSKWWDNVSSIWSDGSTSFKDKIKATMSSSSGLLLGAFSVAKFTPLLGIFAKLAAFLAPVISTLGSVVASVIGVKVALAALVVGFLAFPEKTQQMVNGAVEKIREFAPKIGYYIGMAFEWAIKAIGLFVANIPTILSEWLPKGVTAFVNALKAIATVIAEALNGLLEGIKTRLMEAFPAAAGAIEWVFDGLKTVIYGVKDAVVWALEKIGDAVNWVLDKAGKVAGAVGDALDWASGVTDWFSDTESAAVSAEQAMANSSMTAKQQLETLNTMFPSVAETARNAYGVLATEAETSAARQVAATETSVAATDGMFTRLYGRIQGGIAKGRELLKEGLSKLEDYSPSKSVIVTSKDIRKIGPQAKNAFGKAGKAMDKFGGIFSRKFEGAKNIAVIADRVFKAIRKSAVRLGKALRSTMFDLWADVLEMTAKAVEAINEDSLNVVRQLRTINSASAAALASDSTVLEAQKAPEKTFRTDVSRDQQMYEAIHYPDWYTKEFASLAKQQLAALNTIALKTVFGSAPQSASATVRKEMIDSRKRQDNREAEYGQSGAGIGNQR